MKLSKQKLIFFLTVLVGLALALFVRNYLTKVEKEALVVTEQKAQLVSTIVAAQAIPQGTKIEKPMLKETKVPQEYIHIQGIKSFEEAEGKFSLMDIAPEEIILSTKLASSETSDELPYHIPEGKRAITIAVNPLTGVGGHIKPGHFVDVLGVYIFKENNEEPVVNTLLQNIKVVAVGQNVKKLEGVMAVENITLAVSPEEAEYITLTENIGKMKLTLRPVGEDGILSLPTANEDRLKSKYIH